MNLKVQMESVSDTVSDDLETSTRKITVKDMKKSIFIILSCTTDQAFAACDNDDSEWDSGNFGRNSVKGRGNV